MRWFLEFTFGEFQNIPSKQALFRIIGKIHIVQAFIVRDAVQEMPGLQLDFAQVNSQYDRLISVMYPAGSVIIVPP